MGIKFIKDLLNRYREYLFYGKSYTSKIIRYFILISIVTLIVKIIFLLKEVVLATFYGTGHKMDSYLIALIIPMLFVNLFSGALSTVFIPQFERIKIEKGKSEAFNYFNSIISYAFIILVLILFLLFIFAKKYIPLIASGFPLPKQELIYKLLLLTLPLLIFSSFVELLKSLLNIFERYFYSVLVSGIFPLVITISIILFHKYIGIYSVPVGILAGVILQVLILFIMVKRLGYEFSMSLDFQSGAIRRTFKQFWPLLIGSSIVCLNPVIDKSMATLLPSGSVSVLNYADKFPAFFNELFAFCLAMVILPYFSKIVVANQWVELKKVYKRISVGAGILGIICVIFLFAWAGNIIKLIFFRGAFTGRDMLLTTETLRAYSFQIVFFIIGLVNVRLLTSLERTNLIMITAIGNGILNIIFNLIFMRIWGVSGIAFSTSLVYCYSCILTTIFIVRILREKK